MRKTQTAHPDWSDAQCHGVAAKAVRDLANIMLGSGPNNAAESSGKRGAFALRVTCKNDLFLQ